MLRSPERGTDERESDDANTCVCSLADNIEVAYLKTLTKENIMQFYRVSTCLWLFNMTG